MMKKKLIRIAFILVIAYVLTTLFPQYLFSNKFEYKNFTVYYHSEKISDKDLKSVLDKSIILLKGTKLFKDDKHQAIYVCSSFSEFAFFNPGSRKAFAVNIPGVQNIFLSESSFEDNVSFKNDTSNNKRTLSSIIAHETTHSLLEDKLGFLKNKFMPNWKSEGYCDFIAQESSYNVEKGLIEICDDEEDSDTPSFKYFKYRIMTEYLFKQKKTTLDSFLIDDFNFEILNEEIKKKNCN